MGSSPFNVRMDQEIRNLIARTKDQSLTPQEREAAADELRKRAQREARVVQEHRMHDGYDRRA